MTKLLFVHYGFETGGICTSLLNFVKCLETEKEYCVDILVLNGELIDDKRLPQNVKLVKTPLVVRGCFSGLSEVLKRRNPLEMFFYLLSRGLNKLLGKRITAEIFSYLGRYNNNYDVAVSFANDIYDKNGKCIKCGCNQFVIHGVKAKKKIAWIHAMATQIGYTKGLVYDTYKRFDGIVNCNAACKKIFDEIIPELSKKSFIVNNVLDEKTVRSKAEEKRPYSQDKYNIVTVARIENATKRLDRIPDIVSSLIELGTTDFVWHIIGDGPDLDTLKCDIERHECKNHILLHGRKDNPYPYIKNANLYVQTSDYEAMPMVILEAELLGIPVVSTNYPAAKEMIPFDCGVVIDASNTEKMAFVILDMIHNSYKYNRVSLKQKGKEQLLELLKAV